MSFDPVADIEAFHERFGQKYEGKPRALSGELRQFRIKFMIEELTEYEDASHAAERGLSKDQTSLFTAMTEETLEELLAFQLDALVDLVYVALGTAHLQGFDFREAWRRVHEANMKKIRATSREQSLRGSTFDVIKPEGWKKPDHSDLVADHAHRIET